MSTEGSFWARRKAGVAAEAEAARAATEAHALAEERAVLEQQSDADILAQLDLPDPETMKMGDDFAAFMSKAVPDRIRRRALRTLWRTNPVLANVDMLVDYGEDFTDAATVLDNLQTTYQVGKGMLKHVEEMARQAEERDNPPEPEVTYAPGDDDVLVAATDGAEPAPVKDAAEVAQDETPETPTPRRMKFRAEETA
ncbi:MAG: DUF3306 domain-containing protein [Pseudomonadota bacterium]